MRLQERREEFSIHKNVDYLTPPFFLCIFYVKFYIQNDVCISESSVIFLQSLFQPESEKKKKKKKF